MLVSLRGRKLSEAPRVVIVQSLETHASKPGRWSEAVGTGLRRDDQPGFRVIKKVVDLVLGVGGIEWMEYGADLERGKIKSHGAN